MIFLITLIQHKLNKYYEASISININLIKYVLKHSDTKKIPGIYKILLTHTNILNSAETSISIMNSSNNPDIYDRINKSRRLLYKTLNEEIIEINIHNQKKLNDADKKEFNILFWNDYKRLVDLLLYQNGLLHKNNRFSVPIEKNIDRFIERHLKNSNKILFTVSIIGNQAVQTCYSNNRKYVRIELLDKNYKEKIKKLRTLTDPTLTTGNQFDFSLANDLYNPYEFKLSPNYPNPFNPTTTINYSIAIFSAVNISIYSINGELIQTLVHSSQQPGQYAVQWNASNFPSGLYFVKLISEDKKVEQKVLLIK